MELNKAQRRNLELYRQYREETPTLFNLFRGNLWRYLLMVAFAILAMLLIPSLANGAVVYGVLGLVVGAILRDVGYFRQFRQVWPATAAVLDWERVEALLAGEADVEESPAE
jgi:ABC-type long-subunit fatty acid transport system fused permease/ATPase subunit